jgi:hypothetical protein
MAKFSEKVLANLARKPVEVEDVEAVLANPERDFSSRAHDSHVYSRHIDKRLLLVVVEPDDHEEVITAYYTTPKRPRRHD